MGASVQQANTARLGRAEAYGKGILFEELKIPRGDTNGMGEDEVTITSARHSPSGNERERDDGLCSKYREATAFVRRSGRGMTVEVLMATLCTKSLGCESGGHRHGGDEGRMLFTN